MLVHDVVPQQKIASRFMNPIFPVQTSRNRTGINMGGSNNANMWSTHTSTTTSMAVEAQSAPHHVVTKFSSINRRSAEQTPEYYITVHVRHIRIPVYASTDNTQRTAKHTPCKLESIVRTGFGYWSRNRPSIQDAGPEERPTASPAVGRGVGLFVALGISTHDAPVHRRGSQLAPKYRYLTPFQTTVRFS